MKDVILITTPTEVLLAKIQNLPMKDWSDVIWFIIGVPILYYVIVAFIRDYTAKGQRPPELTETERNKRIMDSIMGDCSNDLNR